MTVSEIQVFYFRYLSSGHLYPPPQLPVACVNHLQAHVSSEGITTNIHVNRMAKWLEGNRGKYLEAET
jgi:hypothetical protein